MRRKPGAGRKQTNKPVSLASEKVGAAIRNRRLKIGISLKDAATEVGISHQALSNIETGQSSIDDKRTRRTIQKLADLYNDTFGLSWVTVKERTEYPISITARVAAGDAVEFLLEGEDADEITVDSRMIKKHGRHFALRVMGDSMEGAHVLSGDIVIVRAVPRTYAPSRNELVIADIRDEGITLKRWKKVKDEVVLIPSTEGYKEIRRPADRVKPVAVVVGVVRMIA